MKSINWTQMSELGLIAEINNKILHPLGLALSRNPETGSSDKVLVAPDGIWHYANDAKSRHPDYTPEELKEKIKKMVS